MNAQKTVGLLMTVHRVEWALCTECSWMYIEQFLNGTTSCNAVR